MMKVEHWYINVDNSPLVCDELPFGTYEVLNTEVQVGRDADGVCVATFVHRVGRKGPPPKVVQVNPAGETNTNG
jgi:hypothetical protein